MRDCRLVSAVGIVGAGRAATLHAEAVRAGRGTELAGVSSLSPTSPRAGALAGALDCSVLSTAELGRASDVVVIAAPPEANIAVLAELAACRRVRAVLIESPAATTIDGVAQLASAFDDQPVMTAVNLLHAPPVRQMLETVASMEPHHLEMRLAVPEPDRGTEAGSGFGGGVTMDPSAGFWPVMVAALGAVQTVATPRLEVANGLDRTAEVVLQARSGRTARAAMQWGASVAEASLEAADPARVARIDIWPVPVLEIDGAPAGSPSGGSHPLAELGFVAQIERLARVGRGEAPPWPDLSAASAAVTIAAAAALSARHDGQPVNVNDTPRDVSPLEILRH